MLQLICKNIFSRQVYKTMLYTLGTTDEIPVNCITSFSMLYINLSGKHVYCKIFPFLNRFCICMLHEQFSRWLQTLHKIILAHHDDNCKCNCGFCLSCGDIDNLSIGTFMRLMLCPPSLRFHGSTIPLFDWQCLCGFKKTTIFPN